MRSIRLITCMLFIITIMISCTKGNYHDLSEYGITPDNHENCSPLIAKALHEIALLPVKKGDTIRIILPKGRYDFYPDRAAKCEYFISNHDQDNPKAVGLPFENMKNVIFDGQGSELIFHGRMLPVSLINSQNCQLKNFSIDFENPHISQIKVLNNDTVAQIITFEVARWVKYEIRDSAFIAKGEGWEHTPIAGIAFENTTKHLVYTTSDIHLGTKHVTEISPRVIKSFGWKNAKLIPGTIIVMRPLGRPTPGIFMQKDRNTTLCNIKIHYAEGMGLLAETSENITLDRFSICLQGNKDKRYFTTQADATHFSGCKGMISVTNSVFENMMDDAINVHGTYLKVRKRINDKTLLGEYMHEQSYGFDWGFKGDTVQYIDSKTMEVVGKPNRILSIQAIDKPNVHGAKLFRIIFENPIDPAIGNQGSFGIENLSWTPEVYFANDTIRNNRARGSLFSTPRKTIVEHNLFDHTSGTAILLCGDCNGWFETGACHNVLIRNNKFINALTNMFQFTNAVISIYPEIPDLKNQKQYFHSGIVIENNEFDTFDTPILYAKSVDGLIFSNNTIHQNHEYPAFHWNKYRFFFQRVTNYDISNNQMDEGYDTTRDLKIEN